jgi:hypothetical protein
MHRIFGDNCVWKSDTGMDNNGNLSPFNWNDGWDRVSQKAIGKAKGFYSSFIQIIHLNNFKMF